ncbi:F-box domain, cyclin-like protein [Akanthomyces lecanii RCEF 1005]|uniref:F-box domain, cyclin-like protein n=1 Tax=Akanthomyces lecanii RCEF 1005 TaxID=1081108 RepID=A0A162JI66_CORDF|nr:F-box domain, cyclin-like protein [Akanthomyces lecanii RCEF 1005]
MDVDMTSVEPPKPSRLLRLPLELLLRISQHLTTVELGHLRLSCGHVEKSLFASFAREFFRHKQFNLTEFSLAALLAISRSRLAPHMRHLHVGLETVSHARMCHTHRSPAATHRHNQLHTRHWIFATTGQDAATLAEALRGLTNLEDVVLRDSNSTRRSRDGPGASWNSYGDATFTRLTGTTLMNATVVSYDEFASYKVFIKTLQALAAADSPVAGIELLLRRHGVPWRGTFYVPEYLKPTMLPVLARLTKLHLVIGDDYRGWSDGDAFNARTWSFDLRQFLSYVPNLRDFRFNGYRGDTLVFALFMEWLAMEEGAPITCPDGVITDPEERAIIESSPPPIGFPHLTRLSLGKIHMKPELLVRLLRKFAPTLEDLALWDVTLAAEDQQELAVWKRLWRDLAKTESGLSLHRVKVGRQKFEDTKAQQARPPAARFVGGRGEVQYEGPDWRAFVREQLETAEIVRFVPQTMVSQQAELDSDDDPEDVDEDDEDEDDIDEDNDEDNDEEDGDDGADDTAMNGAASTTV